MIFMGLALVFGIYDIWDKYVIKSPLVKAGEGQGSLLYPEGEGPLEGNVGENESE
jgi:hypothetical protein